METCLFASAANCFTVHVFLSILFTIVLSKGGADILFVWQIPELCSCVAIPFQLGNFSVHHFAITSEFSAVIVIRMIQGFKIQLESLVRMDVLLLC
jgi:hypothetical protein